MLKSNYVRKETVMYCSNCGKEIDDKAVVCIHCGCATANAGVLKNLDKNMIVALLLWFFFGYLGLHRFYLKDNSGGIKMLLCFFFSWLVIPAVILFVWWIIDLFKIIDGSIKPKDESSI